VRQAVARPPRSVVSHWFSLIGKFTLQIDHFAILLHLVTE